MPSFIRSSRSIPPALTAASGVELVERLIDGGAVDKRELVHACTSPCTLPSAVSTLAGVMGMLAHANARRVVEGVADGRGQRDDAGGLADACRIGRALRDVVFDQDDLDLRHFARAEDLVVLEIGVQHVASVPVHDALLEEGVRDALEDAAVDLADDARGVDGTSAVVRSEDLLDVHAAGLGVDGELNIVDATVGDAFLGVLGDAGRARGDLIGRQLRRRLLQRPRLRRIALEMDASALVARGRPRWRRTSARRRRAASAWPGMPRCGLPV